MRELYAKRLKDWAKDNYLQIGIYNISIMIIMLLRSAGYFHPYLVISVNLVVLFALVMAIILFKPRSSLYFFVFLAFWIFAGILKVLEVDIWAERTSVYAFQSLLIAAILFLFENTTWKNSFIKK